MKISFDFYGSGTNNRYPKIDILQNTTTVFSGYIKDQTRVNLDLNLTSTDVITIQGIGKSFGTNNVWDTVVDSQGNIVEDMYLLINNIYFDDIAMEQPWVQQLDCCINSEQRKFYDQGFYNNGTVSFVVQLPLLGWIIEEKFIKPEKLQQKSATIHSGENRFDYEFINQRINSIRNMLDGQDTYL